MSSVKGGARLDAVLRGMERKLSRPGTVQVGFLEGSTEADGTSVPMIAAIQEFGAPAQNIPPRPFFRHMIAAKSPSWGQAAAALLIAENYDVAKVLGLMGQGIKGQLQQSIKDTNAPPLKPATVARKGFQKPLVDTGTMQNSVDYKVGS